MAKKAPTIKSLLGLMGTKSYGAKRRARHNARKAFAIFKKTHKGATFF